MNPLSVPVSNEPLINMSIPRIQKGMEMLEEVTIMNADFAIVRSQSNPKKFYEVAYNRGDCNCPDNQYRHVMCKHVRAVKLFLERKHD